MKSEAWAAPYALRSNPLAITLNPPPPPNIRYSPFWYIIIFWEYLTLGRVGGFYLRQRGLGTVCGLH